MRKYQKTTGYWVYAHITPTKEVYIGMSKQQPCKRWHPSMYQDISLKTYIEKYGWDNIEHRVLVDGLTKEQAEQVEDWFIRKATLDGFCINKQRSGGSYRDDKQAYYKIQYEKHKEKKLDCAKQYREKNRENLKEYQKQLRSTIEGKIYYRVTNYNKTHTPIETPMEAKQKYLETGYIPNYIKNNDLK